MIWTLFFVMHLVTVTRSGNTFHSYRAHCSSTTLLLVMWLICKILAKLDGLDAFGGQTRVSLCDKNTDVSYQRPDILQSSCFVRSVLLVINHWELCRILPLRLTQEYIALTLWIIVLSGYLKKAQAFFVSLEFKKIHRKNGGNANSSKGRKSKQHEHKSVSVTTILSIIKERLWFYSSLKNNTNPCSIQTIGLLLCCIAIKAFTRGLYGNETASFYYSMRDWIIQVWGGK